VHLVLEKNRESVERIAAWLDTLDVPTPLAWAVELVRRFEKGEELRLEKAIMDQLALSKDNFNAEHTGVEGLGQVNRSIADSLREEIRRRMGESALDDPQTMRKIEQEYGLRFKPTYKRKARVMAPGLKGLRKWHGRSAASA
jgi:hypothetical protein